MRTVSVVIPTHQRSDLLRDAVSSVLAQTVAVAEVLVVDDADDPATREVIGGLSSQQATNLRYLRNPQSGVCHSRNLGARHAQSPLLAFLDDDDVWKPEFVEKVCSALAERGTDFAMSGLVREMPDGSRSYRCMQGDLDSATAVLRPGSMTGSNFVIRREVFERVNGFDPSVSVFNDWDLFIRLIDAGHSYHVVGEPLAEWRHHDGPRIATPTLRRADGLGHFLDVYGSRMDKDVWRDFKATEIGIRRRHATNVAQHANLMVRLLLAHGAKRSFSRIMTRLRSVSKH